jgi:lipoyl(octanoyl) transferase
MRRPGAPGVYVDGAKVAALGIRVTRGRAYHGLALNVDMELTAFSAIDPCGYPGLAVTQTRELGIAGTPAEMGERLVQSVVHHLEHA